MKKRLSVKELVYGERWVSTGFQMRERYRDAIRIRALQEHVSVAEILDGLLSDYFKKEGITFK